MNAHKPPLAPWRATVVTLHPELFPGPLAASLAGEALQRGVWALDAVGIRQFGLGRRRTVDDTPAGGGAGMVLRADVLGAAIDHASLANPNVPRLYLSPRGEPLTQTLARELAAGPGALLLAGRFEGVDERIIEARALREVSIGDYVLLGGELAAMVVRAHGRAALFQTCCSPAITSASPRGAAPKPIGSRPRAARICCAQTRQGGRRAHAHGEAHEVQNR